MSSSTSLYSRLKDNDKQRIAAAFLNARDQKSIMAKVCIPPDLTPFSNRTTANNNPEGGLEQCVPRLQTKRRHHRHIFQDQHQQNEAHLLHPHSFRQGPFGGLFHQHQRHTRPLERHGQRKYRLAPSHSVLLLFVTLTLFSQIDWATAANQFQPSGKITGPSFRTSIQRLLSKDDSSTRGATRATVRKRKPTATNPSPSASGSTQGRKKKAKVNSAAEAGEEDATRSTSPENRDMNAEALPQASVSSKASTPFRHIKSEDADDAAYGEDAQSEEEPQFFPE
jgi:hypothetical protein